MIFPATLAEQWIAAWNRRDLDALLNFYSEEIHLRSPFAKLFAADGTIKNKAELRAYWGEALRRMPNLRLELIAVYGGHLAMSLHYKDDTGRNVIETMLFDENDKVVFETACLDRPR